MALIKKKVWKTDGVSNPEELHRRLSFMMLRRTKEDVGLELPPKTRVIVNLDVGSRHKHGLTPQLFQSKAAMRAALDASADGKLPEVIKAVLQDLEQGNRVVAFTWRRSIAEHVADAAASAGFETAVVHGGVSQANRTKRIDAARRSPGAHLLAATIETTSSSIDLTYATIANFVELTYIPAQLAQAEARQHRSGQTRPTLVRYFIARGTADELILHSVINKLDATEKIIGKSDDRLKLDLDSAPKGEDALKRLYEAMVARQAQEKEMKEGKRMKKKARTA